LGTDIGLYGLFLPENTALITKLTQIISCLHLFFFVVTKTRHNISSKGRELGQGIFVGFVEFFRAYDFTDVIEKTAMQSSQNVISKLLF